MSTNKKDKPHLPVGKNTYYKTLKNSKKKN